MTPDIDIIVTGIRSTVTDVLGTDIALLRGYSEAKARAIAEFTALLARGHAAGEISATRLDRERDELARMVARFVRNIAALAVTTMERLITRVLDFLTSSIGLAARGIGMPASFSGLAV